MSGYQGYNQSEYTGGGFTATTDSSSQAKAVPRRDSITPCTIKQINEAQQSLPDAPYKINNVELVLVLFVGIVRAVSENALNYQIKVEDGTGLFEFRHWLSESIGEKDGFDEEMPDANASKSVPIGKYIHVTGLLKDFNGGKSLQHVTLKVIEDYNRVIYHFLEAVKVHIEAQGVKKKDENSLFVSAPASEESLQDRVYSLIKAQTPIMTEGIPLQYIHQQLGADLGELKEACEALEESAKIYLGVAEDSYLAV